MHIRDWGVICCHILTWLPQPLAGVFERTVRSARNLPHPPDDGWLCNPSATFALFDSLLFRFSCSALPQERAEIARCLCCATLRVQAVPNPISCACCKKRGSETCPILMKKTIRKNNLNQTCQTDLAHLLIFRLSTTAFAGFAQ